LTISFLNCNSQIDKPTSGVENGHTPIVFVDVIVFIIPLRPILPAAGTSTA
jgi:hypothetical protein